MKYKKIQFHADDFGRSKEISNNIIKCIKFGFLDGVSVMINHDDGSHKILKKLKGVSIRLHLNLTEFPKSENNKNLSFLKLIFLNNIQKKKAIKEINSQINKFIKVYKPKELKIDGHEHIHMIPWISEYLLKQKIFNIKELRNANEKLMLPRLIDLINFNYLRNFLACIILKILSFFKKTDLNSPQFAGLLYSGMQNKHTIKKSLNFFKNNNYNNCEILVHPGYSSLKEKSKFGEKYFKFYNSINRKKEYNLCFLKEIKKELLNFKKGK
mgnify:FL=1|tara:strand:- start:842 stop:1648 length:807 start_codon:yes stop_codon:yes gene_type:complete